MRWISSVLLCGAILFNFPTPGWSETPPSIRQPHPLSWMHSTPVGEMPGWQNDIWMHLEVGVANVWNAPHTMNDKRNNNQLEYFADYEQVSAILELGGAITDRLAIAIEIPHAYRSGGAMDNFIDSFHLFLGSRRFNRQFFPENQYNYSVETNGTEFYEDNEPLGSVANVKPKLKYWFAKWENEACPCGMSFSLQAKLPIQDEKFAGTTGEVDIYSLIHLGIPLGRSSALWLTGAYSYLGDNPAMKDWPRNRNYEMYELSFDVGFARNWGFSLMGRMESPYLDVDNLEYVDPSDNPKIVTRNRTGSGWNSLVRWRGSNAFGIKYLPSRQSQLSFWIAEDWGIGNYDASGGVYSNGAPDINFVIQSSFGW